MKARRWAWPAGLAVALFGASPVSPAELLFWLPRQYPTGSGPLQVAAADFDLDQVPDLAVAAYGSYRVAIFRGLGGGAFAPSAFSRMSGRPTALAAGDLNRDLKPDIVVAEESPAALTVLLGRGDGTFDSQAPVVLAATPSDIALGDLDRDGILDCAVNGTGGLVLLGQGDGSFGPPVRYADGASRAVEIVDMDHDQTLDLLIAFDDRVTLLPGRGNGSFYPPRNFGGDVLPSAMAIADLNGDQELDVVLNETRYWLPRVAIFLGDGGGAVAPPTFLSVPLLPTSVAARDLDGDAQLDLAIACDAPNDVLVFPGRGDGSFGSPTAYGVGSGPRSILLEELSGDLLPDLAVTSFDASEVAVFLGRGGGPLTSAASYPATARPAAIAIGDLDGDPAPDVAVADSVSGEVAVLLGHGDGTLGTASFLAAGAAPVAIAIADLNRDLLPDIVVANGLDAGTVGVLLAAGGGAFGAPRFFAAGERPAALAIADLDGDERLDVAVASEAFSGTTAVLLGRGDGTLGEPRFNPAGAEPAGVAIADLNADGLPDLATACAGADSVAVLLGLGDGTFVLPSAFAAGDEPRAIAAGDVDGDSVPDLVVTNFRSGSVAVLHGLGDARFAPAQPNLVPAGPIALAIGELTEDAPGADRPLLDIVVAGFEAGQVAVLASQGGGSFVPALLNESGGGPRALALGDLNGDRLLDVAVTRADSGSVTVLLNLRIPSPTPIELASFEVAARGETVLVSWTTGWESDLAGFHVWRASASGTPDRAAARRVSRKLVPGGRRSYVFVDTAPGADTGARRLAYWLEERTRSGGSRWHGPRTVQLAPPPYAPAFALSLDAAWPNPFARSTSIPYSVPGRGTVSLEIVAVNGRVVRALVDREIVGIGSHSAAWDGTDDRGRAVAAGIYVCRLQAGGNEATRKLVVMR